MFKILAGIFIVVMAYKGHTAHSIWNVTELCFTIGIALIGVGLDSVIHKK